MSISKGRVSSRAIDLDEQYPLGISRPHDVLKLERLSWTS
ncbi:hypothetical protein VD0002_g6437 [Verticillium dahliae]|nr:hypothetical protein VD0002_g6437 [Verticillium dahliae]